MPILRRPVQWREARHGALRAAEIRTPGQRQVSVEHMRFAAPKSNEWVFQRMSGMKRLLRGVLN